MTRHWLAALGVSLGLTLFIELGFALLCRKRGQALLFTALVNALTNPAVVLTTLAWGFPIPVMEALAVLAEGFVYKKSRAFSRPYLFSLAANALSFGLGCLLNLVL